MKPRSKRLALTHIAREVGVTSMTVSRYLRAPDLVAQSTGMKIQVVLDRLGYVPSRVPDILSNASSKAIGVLVPSLSNQVFSAVIQGIESVTEPAGYQIMLAHYGYDKEVEERRIASLISYQVDGFILSECDHTDKTLRMLECVGVPVIEVMDTSAEPIDMSVGLDHQLAGETMVRRIVDAGRKNIVFFAARMDMRVRQRLKGYEKVMAERGCKPVVFSTPEHSSFTKGAELVAQALAADPTIDGIFCCNDDLAIGAMMECQRRFIAIPEQIAIAGFNALDIGKSISPKLASIDTPRFEIGQKAAEVLLEKLKGVEREQRIYDLGFSVYEGESL